MRGFFIKVLLKRKGLRDESRNDPGDRENDRLMKDIDPKRLLPDKGKERHAAFIGKSGELSGLCEAAEISAEEEHEDPGQDREIVGGIEGFRIHSEREKKVRFVENRRQRKNRREFSVFHPGKAERQHRAGGQPEPKRDLFTPFGRQPVPDHGEREKMEDAEQDHVLREEEIRYQRYDNGDGRELEPALEVRARKLGNDSGNDDKDRCEVGIDRLENRKDAIGERDRKDRGKRIEGMIKNHAENRGAADLIEQADPFSCFHFPLPRQ